MAEARAAYRALQRSITKQLSSDRGNQWQIFVRDYFRRSLGEGSAEVSKQDIELAEDCADLLASVKDHKELLLSYNIGIDREKRQMESVHQTAARVGLSIPKQKWQ